MWSRVRLTAARRHRLEHLTVLPTHPPPSIYLLALCSMYFLSIPRSRKLTCTTPPTTPLPPSQIIGISDVATRTIQTGADSVAATSVTGNTTIETTPSPTAGGETESPLPGARDIAVTSSPSSALWVFALYILLFGVSSADDAKLGEFSFVLLRA